MVQTDYAAVIFLLLSPADQNLSLGHAPDSVALPTMLLCLSLFSFPAPAGPLSFDPLFPSPGGSYRSWRIYPLPPSFPQSSGPLNFPSERSAVLRLHRARRPGAPRPLSFLLEEGLPIFFFMAPLPSQSLSVGRWHLSDDHAVSPKLSFFLFCLTCALGLKFGEGA